MKETRGHRRKAKLRAAAEKSWCRFTTDYTSGKVYCCHEPSGEATALRA